MRIYWYAPWPDDRPWASVSLAEDIAGRDHEMVLHTLALAQPAPAHPPGRVSVVADLPTVSPARPWTARWFADRSALVTRRALKRNALIRRLRPDIVHLQLLNRFTDPWLLPQGPLVATVHDVLPHHQRVPWPVERTLLGKLYGALDAVVVHHPVVGEQLHEFGLDPGSIHHIPLVIAPNRASAGLRDFASPTVLFFGSFRANKGIAELCRAIPLLAPKQHLRFHFAGRGDAGLERLVGEVVRSDPRVTADIGYVANDVKEKLFRAASLAVLPYTTFASQSAVLGDAYAACTPVVVSDVGALGASVRDDGTGWVLPSSRPDDIADTIRRALDDPHGWRERSRRATEVAARQSPEIVAASYRRLYATVDRRPEA